MTHRTRTPSDVKWLANELAAMAGELQRIERELARLRARRVKLQTMRAALSRVAGLLAAPTLVETVPATQAHPRYGRRGRLRDYLRASLRHAYPKALDTLTLAQAAAAHFRDTFASPVEELHFRNETVTHTLRKLVDRDEVERVHGTLSNKVGIWRWRHHTPTLDELRGSTAGEARPWP